MSVEENKRHWTYYYFAHDGSIGSHNRQNNQRRHSIIGIIRNKNTNNSESESISLKEAFDKRKSIHQLAVESIGDDEEKNSTSQCSRQTSFGKYVLFDF